jgi:hypothetical protein
LSGIATKRLSYKDNASEKGKSIIEDEIAFQYFYGRSERKNPTTRVQDDTQEELDFKFLI